MKIEDIIQFIEKREPGFRTKIRGCQEDMIENLLDFLPEGRRLPRLYEAFLKALGADAGGFRLLPGGEFLAQALWFHHEENYASYPQSRYFKFGIDAPAEGVDIVNDWFFDLERVSPSSDDAVVVRFEDEGMPEDFETEDATDVYASFGDMLRARIFHQYVLERLPIISRLQVAAEGPMSNRENVAGEVLELLKRFGLGEVTDSSPQLWTGETPDNDRAALVFIPPMSSGVSIRIAGRERKAVLMMVEPIRDQLDVVAVS